MDDALSSLKKELIEHPETAKERIRNIPPEMTEALSSDPDVGFLVKEAMYQLVKHPGLPPQPGQVAKATSGSHPIVEERELTVYDIEIDEDGPDLTDTPDGYKMSSDATKAREEREEREEVEEVVKKLGLLTRIQKMDAGARMKLARAGDRECRSILIKDSNKQISQAVLANPKMSIQEIEQVAASRNVSEDILRIVGTNQDWVKTYGVILCLVNNPKTPIGVSLSHIQRLVTRDLRSIMKSKGIPEVIKTTAKRIVDKRSI